MFNSTNLTLSSDVDQDTYMFGLHERSQTYQLIISRYMHVKSQFVIHFNVCVV